MHPKRISGRRILTALLCAAILGLCGCTPRPEPIVGGTTDKTDPNAPKSIASHEITAFSASFYLRGEWARGQSSRLYTFTVSVENGVLTAAEPTLGVTKPADDALLSALDETIRAYDLMEQNGVYRVTAGLAPDYQACSVEALYASGETLRFTVNNDPEAAWAKAVYLLFADWFAQNGDDSLLPPQTTGTVTDVTLQQNEDGVYLWYCGVNVQEQDAIDGERHLFRREIMDANGSWQTDYVRFPADFYDRVTGIVAAYDLRAFDPFSVLYGMGRSDSDPGDAPALALHMEFDDSHWMQIDTSDEADLAALRPLLMDLVAYFDSLFA